MRAPKGSMHGAKAVRGKQWSTEPGEAGKQPWGWNPPSSSDLQQVALLRAAFRSFLWGCWRG